jgi:hypothetical protein
MSVQRQPFVFGKVGYPDRHPHEERLRALKSGGAPTAVLAKELMDAYHASFPCFISLSQGFRRRDQIHPHNPELGLFCLTVFQDWQVLDFLGTSPAGLLNYLLSRWSPAVWADDSELLQIPQDLVDVIQPTGLVFNPVTSGLDLGWLPQRLACGLSVVGHDQPQIRLPKSLECRGPVHLEGVSGLQNISGITAPGQTMSVIGCKDFQEISLPVGTNLLIRDCHNLKIISGKLTANLNLENCSALEHVLAVFPRELHPGPTISVRRCPRLMAIGQNSSVGRTCGDLTLEDCPELSYLQARLTIRGRKFVSNCPALGSVKGGW